MPFKCCMWQTPDTVYSIRGGIQQSDRIDHEDSSPEEKNLGRGGGGGLADVKLHVS